MRASRWIPVALVLTSSIICMADPIDVGDRKQLLIDEMFIAQSDGITLTPNPPVKRPRQDAWPLMELEVNRETAVWRSSAKTAGRWRASRLRTPT